MITPIRKAISTAHPTNAHGLRHLGMGSGWFHGSLLATVAERTGVPGPKPKIGGGHARARRANFGGMTASPEAQELAVITGASTGMGAATARELARRGFHVLAGVRRDRDADAIRQPGVEPVIIDITNPDHIGALATRVQSDPQGRAVR